MNIVWVSALGIALAAAVAACAILVFKLRKPALPQPVADVSPPERVSTRFRDVLERVEEIDTAVAALRRRIDDADRDGQARHRAIMARLYGEQGGRPRKSVAELVSDEDAETIPEVQNFKAWEKILSDYPEAVRDIGGHQQQPPQQRRLYRK